MHAVGYRAVVGLVLLAFLLAACAPRGGTGMSATASASPAVPATATVKPATLAPTVEPPPATRTSAPTAALPAPPLPTKPLPTTPARTPSPTETPPPAPQPAIASPVPPGPALPAGTLVAEAVYEHWTWRVYSPAPGAGMYNFATLTALGRATVRIDAVARTWDPPVPDVTGDGYPDLWIETRDGGSRCCWGTLVYSLSPELELVLEIREAPDYYGTGTGTFQDLDANGIYEFLTNDPLAGLPCSGPTVPVVLAYEPGRGYVGASQRFPQAYASAVEAHRAQAEVQQDLTRDGFKCDVYPILADYLYLGLRDDARLALDTWYHGADREAFWDALLQSIGNGRFYAAGS